MMDAVVCGRSLPALQAALDLAEVGVKVAVTGEAEGLLFEQGPERDPEGVVAAFMRRAAEPIEGTDGAHAAGALPEASSAEPPLMRDRRGDWAPLPTPNVLGIPAVVVSSDTIRFLGTGASMRAYLDRIMPLLTVGKTRMFGELVRRRLGETVLRRLVEPQVIERYGCSADLLAVAVAAPGLNEALSRTGALSSAVLAYSDRNAMRESRVVPQDGWRALTAALLRKLELYGVELIDSAPIDMLEVEEGWSIELADGRRVDARAVVCDLGRGPRSSGLFGERFDEALPEFVRVHARIDIERPEWIAPGQSALLVAGDWALRIETSAAGRASAHLASMSTDRDVLRDNSPEGVAYRFEAGSPRLVSELEGALREAGLVSIPGANWSIGATAAPFTDLVERDAVNEMLLGMVAEHPSILPVGRVLHGDDLGAALEWSQRETVALRRRLVGLQL